MKHFQKKNRLTVENQKIHGQREFFLKNALNANGIQANKEQIHLLLLYAQTLEKWNKVYQLTSKDSFEEIVHIHFVDCLLLLPHLSKTPFSFLDVGSGAGFPGMVLAIFRPDCAFFLMDSVFKKIAFLNELKRVLNLKNVQTLHTRAENHKDTFDFVACRALSSAAMFVEKTQHLLKHQGKWLLLKSASVENEIAHLNKVKCKTKTLGASRTLLILEKQ